MSDDEKVVSLNSRNKKHDNEPSNEHDEHKEQELVYCSFCGRPNTQVVKMVQGPGVSICSECTMIAVQYLILEDKMPTGEAQKILDAFWRNV